MKHAVITGATGEIGMALINRLVRENIKITVILNPDSTSNTRVEKLSQVEKSYCELHNYNSFCLPDDDYDVFFHLAWAGTVGDARNDEKLQSANCEATLEAVNLASKIGCRKFLGIGSQAEYGKKTVPLTEMLYCSPDTMYGKYKLLAGEKSKGLCSEKQMEFNWVRVLSVYGKYMPENSLVAYSLRCLKNGVTPEYSSGEQIWDFLCADDAAKALFLIAEKGKDGKTYVLGSGKSQPLKEYIKTIHKIVNPDIEPLFNKKSTEENQVSYLAADISELKKDTGFAPETDFSDGIRRLAEEKDD